MTSFVYHHTTLVRFRLNPEARDGSVLVADSSLTFSENSDSAEMSAVLQSFNVKLPLLTVQADM